jgi:hypothetical protein
MFWAGLTPHLLTWCQAFIHTMTPFLNPLPNKTWEGGDTKRISPSQVSVNVCLPSAEDRHRHKQKLKKWVAQNEWRKTCMGPILILLLGTAIGLYSCGTRLWFVQVFSRNTLAQYQKLNITNTKKTRSLAREQQRPTKPKRRVFWH